MTATAGLVHKGRVYMAADSAGVAGHAITIRKDPKAFVNGSYVIGFSGSFRGGQLMRFLDLPEPPRGRKLDAFMVCDFTDALRESFDNAGFLETSSGVHGSDSHLLVGVRGRLFEIAPDFQAGESRDGYMAIGVGDDLVCGALYAMRNQDRPPREKLDIAIRAAAHHSGAVCAPITFAYEPREEK